MPSFDPQLEATIATPATIRFISAYLFRFSAD
jgi:hypothetical protein